MANIRRGLRACASMSRTPIAVLTTLLVSLFMCIIAVPSYASPCPPLPNDLHCYALAEWGMVGAEQVEGQYAGVIISQAAVPGAATGDRINNEMWTLFGQKTSTGSRMAHM